MEKQPVYKNKSGIDFLSYLENPGAYNNGSIGEIIITDTVSPGEQKSVQGQEIKPLVVKSN